MEVYQAPANRFVAGFVGSPMMNFLEGEIRQGRVFESPVATVPLDGTPLAEPGPAILGVRPPDIAIVTEGGDCGGVVDVVERSGATTLIYVRPAAGHEPIRVVVPGTTPVTEGEAVRLRFNRAALHVFDSVTGRRRMRA
jgi:ABC-type sugar transport system ATPase subunit